MTLVIDASIAIKWVVEEPGTSEALALRGLDAFAAPDLLVAECANILWKKVSRGEVAADHASLAARLLERTDIVLHPMSALLDPALRIAIDLDHPAYDCIYLALASELDAPFVTADERLLRLMASLPPRRRPARVVRLSDAAASLKQP